MQAGTQFWDASLAREVEENKLTEASVDRSRFIPSLIFKNEKCDTL